MAADAGAGAGARPPLKVWDPLVRIFHWSLVASVVSAWLTGDGDRDWHLALGYAVLGLIALRVLWGAAGSHYARFSQFMRGPTAVAGYARSALRGRARRHLGLTPLGGWMIATLLLVLLGTGVTGWLLTIDAFFGDDGMQALHQGLAIALPVLVAVHVSGVLFTGRRHRENLVRAMLSGVKRAPQGDDVA